jgi:hypothetical protein
MKVATHNRLSKFQHVDLAGFVCPRVALEQRDIRVLCMSAQDATPSDNGADQKVAARRLCLAQPD